MNHASVGTEVLLSFIDKIPHAANPLRHVFTYSEDRYGAFLAPEGLLGLIEVASGRTMLGEVNTSEYLRQLSGHQGVWERLAELSTTDPPVLRRIEALYKAGLLRR